MESKPKDQHLIPTRRALPVVVVFFLIAYPSAIALVVLACNLIARWVGGEA